MGNRPHVIEEFGVNRPALVFAPDFFTDEGRAAFGDGGLQRETAFSDNHVTQTFIRRAVFIRGQRGGGEPTFVNAAPVQAKSIEVVRVKLETFAGLQKRAGHPAGRKAEQAAVFLQRGIHEAADFFGDSFQVFDQFDAHKITGSWPAAFFETPARFPCRPTPSTRLSQRFGPWSNYSQALPAWAKFWKQRVFRCPPSILRPWFGEADRPQRLCADRFRPRCGL